MAGSSETTLPRIEAHGGRRVMGRSVDMRRKLALLAAPFFTMLLILSPPPANAQGLEALGPGVRKYLRVGTPKVVLEHVEVIDGTGAAPVPDQNITIAGGKITAISAGADLPPTDGTTILDLKGYAVMPGIVGMHNHLSYFVRESLAADGSTEGFYLTEMVFSGPRLYLANGVTTMRTTGTLSPYAQLKLKQDIEAGVAPGPHMDVTGPYLNGASNSLANEIKGPDDA